MANEIIKNNNAIILDWADTDGASLYHCQICSFKDFSQPFQDDNTLITSTYSYTNPSGEGKFFWRHRAQVGNIWQKWSNLNSFIMSSGASADVYIGPGGSGEFRIINRNDVTDYYTLDYYPNHKIRSEHFERVFERNLAGELLSEWYATKDKIILNFEDNAYISNEQKNELIRFYNLHTSFYLGANIWNGQEYIKNIWQVEFSVSPDISLLASGREDQFKGLIELEEV